MARSFGAAGKGDMGHLWVGGQRAARIRPAGQDIDHAGGKARLMHQTREFQQGRRAILGGLQDHGATRRQRRAKFHG